MSDRASQAEDRKADREGDLGDGRPLQYPRTLTEATGTDPSPEVSSSRDPGSTEQARRETPEAPERLPTVLKLISVTLIGLVAILLYSQIIMTLGRINELAPALRIPLLVILIGVLVVTALSTGELLRRYTRLKKKSDYLSKQLKTRLETRNASGAQSDGSTRAEIKERLLLYLREYDVEEATFRGELKQSGMDEASIEALKWERRSLIDLNARRTSEDWIHEFGNRFQGKLDAAADKLIRGKAVHVGAKTAASPFRILDIVAVIYNQVGLMRGLGRIYNLRPDGRETVALLIRAVAGIYVASTLEEPDSSAFGEEIRQELGQRVGSGIFGLISTRLATGVVNGLFIYRTGKWTQQRLRFVRHLP